MLVLSRKCDQKIMIGDGVVITVVKIRGNRVWLGIEAPKEVRVDREEIWLAVQQAKESQAE